MLFSCRVRTFVCRLPPKAKWTQQFPGKEAERKEEIVFCNQLLTQIGSTVVTSTFSIFWTKGKSIQNKSQEIKQNSQKPSKKYRRNYLKNDNCIKHSIKKLSISHFLKNIKQHLLFYILAGDILEFCSMHTDLFTFSSKNCE